MKINFNKYSLIAVAAFGGAVLTGGCTKMLDQNTKTTITDPVFWKTTSDLISGTNYLYASLPGFDQPMEDLYSDFSVDIFGSSFNTISDGSRNVPSGDGNWNGAYAYIRAANNVMEKANDIADDPMKTYCIAQARFFRAFAYWRLVRTYGDVPYIGKTISGREDEALYTPRTDRRAVVDSIYADLDFAAANCPQADQIP